MASMSCSLNEKFYRAARDGKLVDVKRLVHDEGADVNFKNERGSAALHWASNSGYKKVVRFLVKNGADVDCKNTYGYTALQAAARSGHTEVVRFLLENGADIHWQNEKGWTALHYASMRGHIDVAFISFLKGADLSVKNMDGNSPLDVAQNTNVVTVLLRSKKLVQEYPEVATFMYETKADIASLVKQHNSNDDPCPICLESLSDRNTCHALFPCGHKLHYGCSTSLARSNDIIVCPLCRGNFSTVPSNIP
jgi:hypothetical protein